MRAGLLAAASLAIIVQATAAWAKPPQPRDYMLDPPKQGFWIHGDVFTAGAQATVEGRVPVEDESYGHMSFRFSALGSLGYGEMAGHFDIRSFLFTFGVSVGVRDVWRTYDGPRGTQVTRQNRLDEDSAKSFSAEIWPYAEARFRLVIPLESFWFVSNHVVRYEGAPENSFDWFTTNVHDGGLVYRGDAVLFYRNKYLGALGPYVRYMNMPRGTGRSNEIAAGLLYVIRLGIKHRDDMLSLQVLTRPGDDEFGFQILRIPLWVMLAYRASFKLF